MIGGWFTCVWVCVCLCKNIDTRVESLVSHMNFFSERTYVTPHQFINRDTNICFVNIRMERLSVTYGSSNTWPQFFIISYFRTESENERTKSKILRFTLLVHHHQHISICVRWCSMCCGAFLCGWMKMKIKVLSESLL